MGNSNSVNFVSERINIFSSEGDVTKRNSAKCVVVNPNSVNWAKKIITKKGNLYVEYKNSDNHLICGFVNEKDTNISVLKEQEARSSTSTSSSASSRNTNCHTHANSSSGSQQTATARRREPVRNHDSHLDEVMNLMNALRINVINVPVQRRNINGGFTLYVFVNGQEYVIWNHYDKNNPPNGFKGRVRNGQSQITYRGEVILSEGQMLLAEMCSNGNIQLASDYNHGRFLACPILTSLLYRR